MPPKSRKKGERDFSDCKFRSLLTNLPPQIQQMLDRAFDSFGMDATVVTRWIRPVVLANGKTVPENQFFPHKKGADICCADGVAFVLYQSGVVDFGRNPNVFKPRPHRKNAFHHADYYVAWEGNADFCYELPELSNTTDPSTVDFSDWLPGDVFAYYDATGDAGADHVNIYLGPFVEVVDGEDVPTPVYHFFNSSIGLDKNNAFCTPSPLAHQLNYCKKVNRRIHRVRVRAIEQLFRNQISAPIVPSDERARDSSTPLAEIAWRLAEAGGSPYPIGRNLTWHEGVHLVSGSELKNDSVEPFAPGELVLARFGERTTAGDSSFVLARHRVVSEQVRLLAPPPTDEAAAEKERSEDPAAATAKPLYSLYMQLAPLSTYLDEDSEEIEPGIPALYDGSVEPPPGKTVAPEWLRRIWLERPPALIDLIPETAPISLLALTRSGGQARFTEIARLDRVTVRQAIPLKGLESLTISGTTYWILPLREPRNAGAWDQKIPAATVPRARKLIYYNPVTGNTFEASINVPGSTPLVHRDENGRAVLERVTRADGSPVTSAAGTLVRIDAHDSPGLDLSSFLDTDDERDQYDYDAETNLLTFHQNVRRIRVHTTTYGEGEKRTFRGHPTFELAKQTSDRTFEVERADTGARTRTSRVWLKLAAGVWMTDPEIEAAEKLLDDRDATLRTEIRTRLQEGKSCLVGVKTWRSGWAMRDGHLVASDDVPADGLLTIYRQIKGSGAGRWFVEPRAKADADQEENLVFKIPPPPADTMIYPLLAPSGGAQSAVFELMLATTVKSTNQAEIDAVEDANRAKKPLVQKLLRGELVDFRKELADRPELRTLRRERIGQMGDVLSATGGFVKGVHFELFSGENLIDPSGAGSDGAIQPVPKTPWLVYKDTAAEGFFSPDFVNRVVSLLREHALTHGLDLKALDTAFGEDGVVQPAEWIEFCRRNHRALSRLITVHKPEWKTDWTAELTSTSRGRHATGAQRDALAHDVAQMRWWKEDLSLEGITGDDVFFYHPLRFIEWVNTGLDFLVAGVRDKTPKVRVRPLEGGDEIELTAEDAQKASLFRFRTVVGEGSSKNEAPFRVTLENVDTATKSFIVKVRRGAVHVVRLQEPRVTYEFANPLSLAERAYVIPVEHSGSHRNGFLLADGNGALEGCGYDEISVVFKVGYNVRIPGSVTLAMQGDTSFTMSKIEVTGATPASPPQPGRSADLTLTDGTRITTAPDAVVVENARTYVLRVDIRTSTTEVDKSAKLIATFSGGDLPSSKTIEVPVATRTISTSAKNPAKGEDIAKLQLYLSQIHAADGLPCFRSGNAKEVVEIDGIYGRQLAAAIWRFVYTFCRNDPNHSRDDGNRNWSIPTTTSKGENGPDATQSQIDAVSAALLQDPSPTGPIVSANGFDDLFAKRVARYEKSYDHYPVIEAPLIREIVRRFEPPFVLPHINILFEPTRLPTPPNDVTIVDDWNRDGRIGKSTMLPIQADFIIVRPSWADANVERDGDVDIVFELPQASAYRFDTSGSVRFETTLRRALAMRELALFSSETMSSAPADNVLSVRTKKDGRKLGERQLHGSRDLTKVQSGDACRDAAWMQYWLAQIPDNEKPGTRLYKKEAMVGKGRDRRPMLVIDGKWDAKSVAALNLFKRQYANTATTFAALASALRQKAHELSQR